MTEKELQDEILAICAAKDAIIDEFMRRSREQAKRIEELEAALTPFANISSLMYGRDDENVHEILTVRKVARVVIGDFRRAAIVLRKEGNA
jgi:hypothetical protein